MTKTQMEAMFKRVKQMDKKETKILVYLQELEKRVTELEKTPQQRQFDNDNRPIGM